MRITEKHGEVIKLKDMPAGNSPTIKFEDESIGNFSAAICQKLEIGEKVKVIFINNISRYIEKRDKVVHI